MEPGAKTVTPLGINAIDAGQIGIIVAINVGASLKLGHAGGYSGAGSQSYVELLAGDECGSYTSADNTAATRYFPEVSFFYSIMNQSRDTAASPNPLSQISLQCKVNKGSLTIDNLSRSGDYRPDLSSPASNYLFLEETDTIFGRFSRIAIDHSHVSGTVHHRAIITKGV